VDVDTKIVLRLGHLILEDEIGGESKWRIHFFEPGEAPFFSKIFKGCVFVGEATDAGPVANPLIPSFQKERNHSMQGYGCDGSTWWRLSTAQQRNSASMSSMLRYWDKHQVAGLHSIFNFSFHQTSLLEKLETMMEGFTRMSTRGPRMANTA
jgi:hypothetical protein